MIDYKSSCYIIYKRASLQTSYTYRQNVNKIIELSRYSDSLSSKRKKARRWWWARNHKTIRYKSTLKGNLREIIIVYISESAIGIR